MSHHDEPEKVAREDYARVERSNVQPRRIGHAKERFVFHAVRSSQVKSKLLKVHMLMEGTFEAPWQDLSLA